jgi:hypothetical protein
MHECRMGSGASKVDGIGWQRPTLLERAVQRQCIPRAVCRLSVCIMLKLGDPSVRMQRFGGARPPPPGGTVHTPVTSYLSPRFFTLPMFAHDAQMVLRWGMMTCVSLQRRMRRCSARCSTQGEGRQEEVRAPLGLLRS